MNFDDNLDDFLLENSSKPIILYGASSRGVRTLFNLLDKGFPKNLILFCDSNEKLWDTYLFDIKIISLTELESFSKNTKIIISSSMYKQIAISLEKLGFNEIYFFNSLLFSDKRYEKFDSKFLSIMKIIGNERRLDYDENYTLYSSIININHLDGDIAEVGVYRGGTAKLICEVKGNKSLFLFDTFEGLPETHANDLNLKKNWLNDTSVVHVRDYLNKYENVHFLKGLFPETAKPIKHKIFSFVHLDTDLYKSTLDALEFFWPRLVLGGRIVSHDYNTTSMPGIKKAFKEFFKDNPEKLIEIADTQIMVIK